MAAMGLLKFCLMRTFKSQLFKQLRLTKSLKMYEMK